VRPIEQLKDVIGLTDPVPVSVVVPCWRCGDTITRAVESIASQTRLPREVILVDDASGDGTLSVLRNIAKAYPQGWIRIIEQRTNGGPGTARNVGWESSSSPYIAFLDADDAWHPRKLEIQVSWMDVHQEAAMTGTQSTVMRTLDDLPPLSEPFRYREATFGRMLFVNMLPTRSVIIRASVPNRFLPGRRYGEDYLLWVSVIAEGNRAFQLEVPISYCFKRDFGVSGLSSRLWLMHLGALDTYRRLYQAGHISGAMRTLLFAYSFARFLRLRALSF
jgi:glycosyltransferase involved in cell wall biosynthesis